MTENIGQRGSPRAGRVRGFTLIELMVVFMIISLLVTILLPTINSMLATRANLRAKNRIALLANGASSYQKEYGFYPGQEYPGLLDGGAVGTTYSGSQILAATMFGYFIEDPANGGSSDNDILGTPEPATKWAPYEVGVLATLGPNADKRPNTISDGFANPMAICYYPSQMTGGSGLSQFQEVVNEVYTVDPYQGTGTNDEFGTRITHPRLGGAVNAGGILLIAPGPDRLYFTKDDLKNW
jgi:prepilin-type N-terminal cleavage/methylation domain-containing protein